MLLLISINKGSNLVHKGKQALEMIVVPLKDQELYRMPLALPLKILVAVREVELGVETTHFRILVAVRGVELGVEMIPSKRCQSRTLPSRILVVTVATLIRLERH